MKLKTLSLSLKAQAGRVKFNELYTLALITIGLPYVFYIYFSWREAVAAFVVTQIALGLINARI